MDTKFKYTANGGFNGGTLYDVQHLPSTRIIGCVAKQANGTWTAYLPYGREDYGFRTRDAAANRLLHVVGVSPAAWSALPSDPFDGIAAVTA